MTLRLFDTHCHLNMDEFADDRPAVLTRARRAGVQGLVVVGFDLASSRAAVALAESFDGVFAAVGVHPHDAPSLTAAALQELKSLARSPRVVAWGEIGLDYYRDRSPRDEQRRAFQLQIAAAQAEGLPVIVHSRDAAEDTWAVLAETVGAGAVGPSPGIMHCFSYDAGWAERFLSLGFYLSFAGNITFPSAGALRNAARAVPGDRLLSETDAPYLAPVPHRGHRNEPAYVEFVVRQLALARGTDVESQAAQVFENAVAVFRLQKSAMARAGDLG